MRKAELDRLLLTAVAEAIGQPVPKPKRQKAQRMAQKRTSQRYRPTASEHHAHI
jgi:hypothetical protein